MNLASHPVIARATVTRSTVRSLPPQSHQQQPSRPNLALNRATVSATATRSRPRTRLLRRHQWPPSGQHPASQPCTATRSTLHTQPLQALWAAEPIEPGVAPGNSAGNGNGNGDHATHSAAANASAAAQPPEPASATGDEGSAFAFHFKNQGGPFTPTTTVELEELNSSPLLPGRGAELAAILEVDPAAMHEHAASHVDNGQHRAIVNLPPELLT